MELRKKILAKVEATTQATPQARMATGACSREEPDPKFSSATMMSPFCTRRGNVGSRSSRQCFASSAGSVVLR